jgi:hypothetical protein
MSEPVAVISGLAVGATLSAVFFIGLWLTTRNLHNYKPWMMGGFFLRLAFCGAGFVLAIKLLPPAGYYSTFIGFVAAQLILMPVLSKRLQR